MTHALPILSTALLLVLSLTHSASADEWRRWRGPSGDNHAPPSAVDAVPITWSESENVAWRTAVPGKGHATPIVVADGIFVLTHEAKSQSISLLRYDLSNGKASGRVVLHTGVVPPRYLHQKNTCASGTPSSDGNAVYVVAQVNDSIQASAVSLQGKILWQQTVAPYRAGKGWFGYGSSLLLLDDSVVIPVDTDNQNSGLYALDKRTGKPKWKSKRPLATSYSSPSLATINGTPQILLSGGYQVSAYNPNNGNTMWSVKATSRTTCATMVWNDTMAFASGSYPDPGTYGIRVSPSGATIAWENGVKCYEQSMLVAGDFLYGISDGGIAYCWRCDDGQEMWKARLEGPFSASPILIGDRIYASNERGKTYVFRASPDRFAQLAVNEMGESSFASPVYADEKLLLRHATNAFGPRQEFLVAIGK